MISSKRNIEKATAYADVVVGAVLVTGQRAPVLLHAKMVQNMKPRSVIVDLSIDQGGCFETSRPTTHEHACLCGGERDSTTVFRTCPGVVARTATHAFVNAAMPYIRDIANHGADAAASSQPGPGNGDQHP
ncbi:MAG: hypothetical protein M0C28_34270 [Candidatus Moduliflexus flocculans]|nr:hypothetical protein [Candidatus Moduliflexus flocculans]